jgi:hypothetical protein
MQCSSFLRPLKTTPADQIVFRGLLRTTYAFQARKKDDIPILTASRHEIRDNPRRHRSVGGLEEKSGFYSFRTYIHFFFSLIESLYAENRHILFP